jgi:Tfp pilus assembly protein PilN
MIKVNLLHSVTERQGGAVASVERKVGSPVSRLLLMSLAVGLLLAAVVGWDVISTQMAKADAEQRLEEQKRIETELAAVLKEQKELEEKIKSIEVRIEAIKKLRAEQAGPSAVLEALRERIAMVPGLYLETVEQQGDMLTIKGNSPDEGVVTQFGRSLEFSGGLFSNLSIETQRKEVQSQQTAAPVAGQTEVPKLEVVNFTIRCAYKPSEANQSSNTAPTVASVAPQAQPNKVEPVSPQQVAKNQQ